MNRRRNLRVFLIKVRIQQIKMEWELAEQQPALDWLTHQPECITVGKQTGLKNNR